MQVSGGPGAQPHPPGRLYSAQPLRPQPLRPGGHVHPAGGATRLQMSRGSGARPATRGEVQHQAGGDSELSLLNTIAVVRLEMSMTDRQGA